MTRRQALLLTGATLSAQQLTPVEELANTFEMEAMAKRKLSPALFALIAGSDRTAFDRITLRPRLLVNTTTLDLSLDLFGQRHFAPILIGPTSQQGRFHPEAELAMAAGAAAANALVVYAADTTIPIEKLPAPCWQQIDPARGEKSIQPHAKALVLTAPDWKAFERLAKFTKLPIVLKGVLTPKDAQLAVQRGAHGIIISSYGNPAVTPMEVLPSIAKEVNNKIPILIDGSFRRGSDVFKALALGASAVLLGRPPLWGLAAYGARGVQQVLEQLQTELARDMAMCGKVNLHALTPDAVKIHRR